MIFWYFVAIGMGEMIKYLILDVLGYLAKGLCELINFIIGEVLLLFFSNVCIDKLSYTGSAVLCCYCNV
jgi:hypothetical protein